LVRETLGAGFTSFAIQQAVDSGAVRIPQPPGELDSTVRNMRATPGLARESGQPADFAKLRTANQNSVEQRQSSNKLTNNCKQQ